jgi:peroxiredoxin family protein
MAGEESLEAMLVELAAAGDVRLYACTSSMYVWGVSSQDLIPAMAGGRGLIAFLAEDLAGAADVLTY